MAGKIQRGKQLFIIGNGFDRAHGLGTSYQDFYYYLSREDATSENRALRDFLIEHISNSDENNNGIWSNFEELIGYVDFEPDIELTSEYGIDRLDDDADKDADYYDYQASQELQWDQLSAELLPTIFARWISSIDLTDIEMKENFKRLIHRRDEFLTFNYTHTLEELYGVFRPCHIHGTIDADGEEHDIMVGHGMDEIARYSYEAGDRNPLGDFSSIDAIEACMNRARSIHNSWKKDVAGNLLKHQYFFSKLHNIKTVYSYGFSYGSVDMPYIREIICNLQEAKKVQWLLEDYNEADSEDFASRIREAGFIGSIGRFSLCK